jgi:hypothetical protein
MTTPPPPPFICIIECCPGSEIQNDTIALSCNLDVENTERIQNFDDETSWTALGSRIGNEMGGYYSGEC